MTQETVVSLVDLRLIMKIADINERRKREAATQEQSEHEFSGFHKFVDECGGEYGSFEVFYASHSHDSLEPGWYWWSCFPGCLPDSEPSEKFPTAEGAFLAAQGE